MTGIDDDRLPHAIKAEAAAWLARLHADDRAPADEAAFQAWLTEDERHARAFDLVTTAWDAAGGLAAHDAPDRYGIRPVRGVSRRALVLGGAAALAVPAIGLWLWQMVAAETYATGIGEQRRIALADGSSVLLDTDTRVRIAFGDERRLIELVKGRAYFDVATDPLRPFLVRAGDRQVIAIGTAFEVTRHEAKVAVVLVEGRVAVQPVGVSAQPATRMLAPGDRLVFEPAHAVVQDQPDLARVTAWREGRAMFDDEPLSEAVAEMNRYSQRPLVIADAGLGAMRISGVYGTGDTEAFAKSVATLLPVSVTFTPTRIILDAGE